jgi:hypothetical protein
MMVGIATAGPLVINGTITPLEAIRTLVITSLIHNLYAVFRMSFPVFLRFEFAARLELGRDSPFLDRH